MTGSTACTVTTIENEYAFYAYVDEAGARSDVLELVDAMLELVIKVEQERM